MDPPVQLVEGLLGPAAPFVPLLNRRARLPVDELNCSTRSPAESLLQAAASIKWRYHGAAIFESRLFIYPEFATGRAPGRVDVILGDGIDLDSPFCRELGASTTAFACEDQLESLPIVKHAVKALEYWSSNQDDFERRYLDLPFGSVILIEDLPAEIEETPIEMVPLYETENRWLSVKVLRSMWEPAELQWPIVVPITELKFVGLLHTAISLVTVPGHFGEELVVFKSSVQDVRFMYHELKALLTLEPHPNIVSRPLLVVTKQCRFGAKNGVCGFVLKYYHLGTLKHALRSDVFGRNVISEKARVRWALQIVSALKHVYSSPAGYYSDSKLDNIVLEKRDNEIYPVLIDFERRGAWFSWSPPEINHIMCLDYLATIGTRFGIPAAVSQKYRALLQQYLPSWSKQSSCPKYQDQDDGCNEAWKSFNAIERQRTTVFMLGKILWCLFEGNPTTNSAISFGAEIYNEVNPHHRFPEFRRTVPKIQCLIKRCINGAPELEGHRAPLVRVDRRLCLVDAVTSLANTNSTEEMVQNMMRRWWSEQVETAETFLKQRHSSLEICKAMMQAMERPSLEDVYQTLADYLQELGEQSTGL